MTWLLDGLGGAVIGGAFSTMIALLVVRLTVRSDRRLARERETREAAVRVLTLGKSISTLSTAISGTLLGFSRSMARERDVLLREFQVATFVLDGALRTTDPGVADELELFLAAAEAIDPDFVLGVVNIASRVIAPGAMVKPSYGSEFRKAASS